MNASQIRLARKYHITLPSPNCKVCGALVEFRALAKREQGGGTAPRYCSRECADEARLISAKKWRRTPHGKFATQRGNARRRGIEFLFSFEQWVEFWGADVSRIGKTCGMLVMGRYGDVGPYSPENCYKSEFVANLHDAPRVIGDLS